MDSHLQDTKRSSPPLNTEGAYNVVDFILQTIKQHGNEIAQIESETKKSITFEEIIGRVNWLGSLLVNAGIRNGDVICIISKNSLDYSWLLLGALQAGAACALYSPYTKKREIAHFVKVSKPRYVIAPEIEDEQLSVLLESDVEVIYTTFKLNHYGTKIRPYSELIIPDSEVRGSAKWKISTCKADLDDPALILASSGSTGLPKGVLLSHNNLVSALCHSKLLMRRSSIGLGLMPFFHAYGLGLMLMALCEGTKFITMSKFSMDKFLEIVQTYKISNLYLVPSLVASLGKSVGATAKELSSVREIFTGAGPITLSQQKSLLAKLHPSAKLYHSYGMTETTFVVLFGEHREDKPGSAGTLVPGIKAQIVTENGNLVKPGQIGELQLKGSLVMLGYFENEEATNATKDKNGWLHTGDLVFKDIDGYYYIIDRIKELIKYQGFQISPTELELALLEHKAIAEVAVIGVPHEIYGEVPKAFVVKNKGYDISENEIISLLRSEHSSYKQLRGGVEFIEQLPKSPSGKILKKKLRELVQ
ncbi:4-coumarate--CoA ligase 1-like [Cimex lectularius]|uniref:Uncharacterized protein n=1 Tax=Cimex lectularius TaxID=79782 RepID=A0A8I6SBJ0_CIMLE|nr:4-coumarate--CoA ligase 1-like [Cimex lectularius]